MPLGILILEQDFLIGVWRYSSQIHPMCYKRIFSCRDRLYTLLEVMTNANCDCDLCLSHSRNKCNDNRLRNGSFCNDFFHIRLFPTLLAPSRTALIRGFSQYLCNESARGGQMIIPSTARASSVSKLFIIWHSVMPVSVSTSKVSRSSG